ncbi:MAG TPA: hypothetical protein DCF33_21810 [Saprospirales bacterium]|nr:hypothetical protein [Saprospirales bacterium]
MVEDPELLRRITYEELKTLALAYPYAPNLRYLLAIKARQIDHPDAGQNLATAAAYSLDRTRLFMLTAPQMIAPQQILAPEEVLELKPIETVKRELEALAPMAREENINGQSFAASAPTEPPVIDEPKAPVEPIISQADTVVPSHTTNTSMDFDTWIGSFNPPVLKKNEVSSIPHPKVTPRGPVRQELADDEYENATEPPKTQGIAHHLAEKSVTENQDVVSETLAKLYAKQGYRDKAAQMYARLALLFPEKSTYFAAEIDKLKK